MSKILTVSIAAYNVEKYINNALNTFANSKYDELLEVFIIDDGGSDKTLQVANEYAERFPKIFFPIHKKNGGWGSTLNYGIEHANGKYFKQLDGDDKFVQKNLDEYLETLKSCDADLVYTPYLLYDDTKNRIIKKIDNMNGFPQNTNISFAQVVTNADVAMHSCTFRTEILKKNKVHITEKCFYTDIEYVLKSCSYVKDIYYCNVPVYWYRVSREGQSMSYSGVRKHYMEHQKVTLGLLKYFEENPPIDQYREFVRRKLLYLTNNQYSIYGILKPSKKNKDQLRTYDSILKHRFRYYFDNSRIYIKIWRLMNFNCYTMVYALRMFLHRIKSNK